jgi:hypothetical protein
MGLMRAAWVGVVLALVAGRGLARAEGDLDRRMALSVGRLEQGDYSVKAVLEAAPKADWPGDIPGRLILAWTAIAEATGKEPPELKALVDGLPTIFNEQGYIGAVQDVKAINEQQISGHGWLISGLCRYATYSGDARAKAWAARIVKNLALPLAGKYATYPHTPDSRNAGGRAAGRLTGRVINDWKVSTDIGCCYILLEGLVAAEKLMPSPELEKLIEEAGESFLSTDVKAVQAQTHASLCAARNVLLFDEASGGKHGWLPKVEAFYRIYRDEAMTETEANWNWFGRPTWSEPCAMVDAYLLTTELWRATGKAEYLEDAQRIFYNGLGYGEKPTGGFGCDVFTAMGGAGTSSRHWDVPWCCNMRGAVGLSGAMAARTEVRGEALLLPFYADGEFAVGGWKVTEKTGWPVEGEVVLKVEGKGEAVKKVGFFVPPSFGKEGVKVSVNGKEVAGEWKEGFLVVGLEAGEVRLTMPMKVHAEAGHNVATKKGLGTIRHGLLVLGTPDNVRVAGVTVSELKALGGGKYETATGVVLSPIAEMPFSNATEKEPWRTQVLFRGGEVRM